MRLKSVKIVLTFFFLWITTQFDIQIENYLAYFFILSLGILHGSNDVKLVGSINNLSRAAYVKIVGLYVMTVAVTFVIFIIFPRIGLLVFVIISGYHFGEQHLNDKLNSVKKKRFLLFTFYGLLIFSMIFFTHIDQVNVIIKDISGVALEKIYYTYFIAGVALLTIIQTIIQSKTGSLNANIFEELAYLALFYVLFLNSTLFWSFAIYFIVWHSIPSLKDQIINLYDEVSIRTVKKYLKESLIFWIISVVGIILLVQFTKEDTGLFNLLFFALLAAITLPHVIILGKMHD